MNKPKMYAKCLNNNSSRFENRLEEGKEYRIVAVKTYKKFGDVFLILEDGLAYNSGRFTVTYLK